MAKILVVEDDVSVRTLVLTILEVEGHEAIGAESVPMARSALADHAVDFVICDVQLPGGSGLELLRELARDLPHVGVFMLSGDDDLTTAAEALALGATAYVVKPFSANEILINVANGLRLRELERAHVALRDEVAEKVVHRAGALRTVIRDLSQVDTAPPEPEVEDLVEHLAAALGLGQGGQAHLHRLRGYAGVLGEAAGWPPAERHHLGLACMFHDAGTIGVSDAVLHKSGELDPVERATLERHPLLGHRLLLEEASPITRLAATIALTHRERWDGQGFPRGLVGPAIPLEGRIAAVVIGLEAQTSWTASRLRTLGGILATVTELGGSVFDPALTERLPAVADRLQAVWDAHPPPSGVDVARILLVDDHVMFTDSVARLLASEPGFILVGAEATAEAAIEAARRHRPDVVLMAWELPDGSAEDATREILAYRPETKVVLLTARTDDAVFLEAVKAGCSAFLSKQEAGSELVRTIRAAQSGEATVPVGRLVSLLGRLAPDDVAGRTSLSARELEVLALLTRGMEVDAIATHLVLSIHTVRNHLRNAMVKLGAHSRLEAVTIAVRQGLVHFS